jgi:hypothetical protein
MLAFFLLDMGLMVARNFADACKSSPVLIAYAAIGPLVHAGLALLLGALLGMSAADVAILMVLSASASYIVVPRPSSGTPFRRPTRRSISGFR